MVEYWLIDPSQLEAVIYILGDEGTCRRFAPDAHGHLVSTLLPDFTLDASILWQDELPNSVETLRLVQAMIEDR